MASLVKQLSGRKKESAVWKYFEEQPVTGNTKCSVILVKDGKEKPCGMIIKGKNTTNLKSHLEVHHESLYKELKSIDTSAPEMTDVRVLSAAAPTVVVMVVMVSPQKMQQYLMLVSHLHLKGSSCSQPGYQQRRALLPLWAVKHR